MDVFLDSLINLQLASLQIPTDFSFKFDALNDEFARQSASAASSTLSLCQSLTSYILCQPVSDFEVAFSMEADRAVTTLLARPDLNVLHCGRKAVAPSPSPIEHHDVNGLHFIISRHVTKPVKFVHSNSMPETIPSLNRIPPIDAFDLDVNISDITLVSDCHSVAEHVDALRATGDILFVAFFGHRVRTYRPFPCLCIVMTPEGVVVVFDILALRSDLGDLGDLLADPDTIHVMQDPDMDLQMLAESLGMYVSNVLPVDGPDGSVVVDWRIRPLTKELLSIAVSDVRDLPQLARLRIETTPVDELLRDAQRYAVAPLPQYRFNDAEIAAEVDQIGADDADRELVVDLVKWRDAIAALEDEAPNFIAPNACLRQIAVAKPRTIEQIKELLAEVGTPYTTSLARDLFFIVRTHYHPHTSLADEWSSKLGSP
jgi:hypothetical protein